MAAPPPSVFREEALQYRLRNQGRRSTEVSFPRFMARRVMVVLWVLLGVLGFGAVIACMPSVPVNAAGMAIGTTERSTPGGAPLIAVLMPLGYEGHLVPGNDANVYLGASDRGLDGTIVAVEREAMSAAEVSERVGLPATALSMLPPSVTVIWVTLDAASPNAIETGNFGWADLEIGSTPAGSYLPLVGRFFEE